MKINSQSSNGENIRNINEQKGICVFNISSALSNPQGMKTLTEKQRHTQAFTKEETQMIDKHEKSRKY